MFEAIVHDLREVLRVYAGPNAKPSAVILDSRTSRTLQGTPESAGHGW